MAKKSKNLLPKRIAGVKVPKAVRKGRLGDAIASPAGRAVLAEVLLAAAAVAGAKKVKDSGVARDALSDVADRLRDAGGGVKDAGAVAGGTVTYAIGEAARAFVDAFDRRRSGEGKEAEAWTPTSGAAESKKKPSSYEGAQH